MRTFNFMATVAGCAGAILYLGFAALLFAAALALLSIAGVI